METVAVGSTGRVGYHYLEPDEDVLAGISRGIGDLGMTAGIVLAVTGAASNTRLSKAVNASVENPPGFVEFAGTAEVDGCGSFGRTQDSRSSGNSQIRDESGKPFVHAHRPPRWATAILPAASRVFLTADAPHTTITP